MKLLGIIHLIIGILLCIRGGTLVLIDSKEERRVKAVINYHNPTNSWPSKIRNGRVDIDGIQDSLKQNIEANAKLKSLQSRDKWWFI